MKTALDSEDAILAVIDRHFPNTHPALVLGRGDDCAELAPPPGTCAISGPQPSFGSHSSFGPQSSGAQPFFAPQPLPLALSSDLFVEHIHFRRSYFSLRETGHKALAVNLSDLAAAGAAPAGFSLCLMLPPGFSAEEAEELFGGMAELAQSVNIPLTGGDLSLAPDKQSLGFSITVWGYPADQAAPVLTGQGGVSQAACGKTGGKRLAAPPAHFLRRGQARPGDLIFVAQAQPGPLQLGLARCGLLALEALGLAAKQLFPRACAAHLMPRPLIAEGLALARFRAQMEQARPGSTAQMRLGLMDVSDGLARDLPRLLNGGACKPLAAQTRAEPNTDGLNAGVLNAGGLNAGGNSPVCEGRKPLGAALTLHVEQLHPELKAFASNPEPAALEKRVLALALAGGEDYCLLGTCAPEYFAELQTKLPALYLLGEARAEEGIFCNATSIAEYVGGGGFDHFTPV